jgi:predicted CXXCH cytochrome family protein
MRICERPWQAIEALRKLRRAGAQRMAIIRGSLHPDLPVRFPVVLALAALAAPAFVASALSWGPDPIVAIANQPLMHRNGGFTGSLVCRDCHLDHYDSWRRTHHAQMTQRPGADNVRGAFDGRVVRYEGQEAKPFRDGGKFLMDVPTTNAETHGRRVAEVVLMVGSRRYQQYFEQQQRGDSIAFVRLPILWHIEQQRWMHLNTVFLGPDEADWNAHAATWNENCIFCHNTAPEPRARANAARANGLPQFDSEVAELGISCESCHGPGAEHARSQQDPLVRYSGSLLAGAQTVNPTRLDQERSVSVCGQCHGARLPKPLSRVRDWFDTGPTYRAGDKLLEHVTPIERDTKVLSGDPEQYALRFWGDGTARLSAYELQGVLASPCFRNGPMTCQSCHSMHTGDPHGQLRPDRQGNALCTQCHEVIARDVRAHTHHDPAGSGSACVECHMPKIVYGVLEIHRSHRIELPDPARDAEAGRPHACTLCHTDQTLPWVAQQMQQWWGTKFRAPTQRADRAPLTVPDAIASLHAGDAAVRAVYAAAFGRATAAPVATATVAQRAHLAVAMGDGYPSVRWLAQRSLQQLEQRAPIGLDELLHGIDSMAGPEARRNAVFATLDGIARNAPNRLQPPPSGALLGVDLRLDLPAVIRLTDLQGRNVISIGE